MLFGSSTWPYPSSKISGLGLSPAQFSSRLYCGIPLSYLLEQGNDSVELEGISWVTELNFPPQGTESCNPVDRQRHTQEVKWPLVLLDYLLAYKWTDI